jgi:hypothetical protein
MQVFPGKPYWLGCASNGSGWPEYLATATSLGIKNRSYGGTSVDKPLDLHKSGLLAFIKDEGRFFVSGRLEGMPDHYSHIATFIGNA